MLEIARHLARVAQGPADRHMQDALAALEDALADHLAAIETAADDDKADAEDSGEAERERRAWRPLSVTRRDLTTRAHDSPAAAG